jgi:hypothetical protein
MLFCQPGGASSIDGEMLEEWQNERSSRRYTRNTKKIMDHHISVYMYSISFLLRF